MIPMFPHDSSRIFRRRVRVCSAIALASLAVPDARSLHAQSTLLPPPMIGAANPRIDSLFHFVAEGAPGCGVGIYNKGELTWARGYGLASVEHRVPISQRTAFDIGSTSKQFTAALALLLAGEGRVALDAPVRTYVPELPSWGDTVTVQQLLHHTGGVRDYISLMRFAGVSTHDLTTQAEAVRAIARQRALDFAPGTRHSYSNSGYLLLAEIVARTSGRSFSTYARERIFAPLGMTHTFFLDTYNRVIPNRATGYRRAADGFTVDMSNWQQVGDGAVITTLEDLAIWVRHLESERGRALARDLETQVPLDGQPLFYARGVMVDSTRGIRRVRHGGSWAGFNSELVRLPGRQLAVAALCNRADANPVLLADQITDILLDDLGVARVRHAAEAASTPSTRPTTKPSPTAVGNAASYAGMFLGDGSTVRIQARGDSLYASAGGEFLALRGADSGRFELIGAPVQVYLRFFRGQSGSVDSLEVDAMGRRVRAIRWTESRRLAPAVERSLVGDWYSDELDARWRIEADSVSALTLHLPRQAAAALRVLTDNLVMTSGGTTLRLEHGADGRVRAFVVESERAKGVRFTRAR